MLVHIQGCARAHSVVVLIWFGTVCFGQERPADLNHDTLIPQTNPKQLSVHDAQIFADLQSRIEKQRSAGNFAKAVESTDEALALLRRALGQEHWQVADALRLRETLKRIAALPEDGRHALASISTLEKRRSAKRLTAKHSEIVAMDRQLLEIRRKWSGNEHAEVAASCHQLASDLFLDALVRKTSEGLDEAESLFNEALAIRLESLGVHHPDTATTHDSIAHFMSGRGRHDEAKRHYEQALAIRVMVLGDKHSDTLSSMNYLAIHYQRRGLQEEATALYGRLVDLRTKSLGESHIDTIASMNSLGACLSRLRRYGEAELNYRKVLDFRFRTLGEGHADTIASRNNLANTLYFMKKYAQAEPHYRRILEHRLKVLGENHLDTAKSFVSLANCVFSLGRHSEAEPLYQRALEIRERRLGEHHPETIDTYNVIARNLTFLRRYGEAAPIFHRVLAYRRDKQGVDHSDTVTTIENLASCFLHLSEYSRADSLYRELLKVQLAAAGESHSDTVNCLTNLANCLYAQEQDSEADALLQRALSTQIKLSDIVRGEAAASGRPHSQDRGSRVPVKHLETEDALSVDELIAEAFSLRGAGRFSEAQAPLRRAQEICERVLGTAHWQTVDLGKRLHDVVQMAELPEHQRAALATASALWKTCDLEEDHARYAQTQTRRQRVLEVHRQVLGDSHRDTAKAFFLLANNLRREDNLEEAETHFRRALDLQLQVVGQDHLDTAQTLIGLANSLVLQDKAAAAASYQQQAVAIWGRLLGDDAAGYLRLAAKLEFFGQYAESEPLYRAALALRQDALGEEHLDTVNSYIELADNLAFQNKHGEAEALFRRALASRSTILGREHVETIAVYGRLAGNLASQRKYAVAETLWRKYLASRRRQHGESHADTAGAYSNLARSLYFQRKYAEAERLDRKALAIRQKVLGESHADVAVSLNQIADDLERQEARHEAEPLRLKAATILLRQTGESDALLGFECWSMADTLSDQGKLAQAEAMYRMALEYWLKWWGESDSYTGMAYEHLAYNLYLQGKDVDAEFMARRALAIYLKTDGDKDSTTAACYNKLALILSAQDKDAEAERLFRKALEIAEREGEVPAAAYNNLACALEGQSKYTEAEVLHRKALAIAQKSRGATSEAAYAYLCLAENLYEQGRYVEAEPLYRSALDSRTKASGKAHYDTAGCHRGVARVLDAQGQLTAAVQSWIEAAEIEEQSRRTAGFRGLERALISAMAPTFDLATGLARQGNWKEAWMRWESNLARGLLDEYSAQQLRPLTPEQRQQEARLLDHIQEVDESVSQLEIKSVGSTDEQLADKRREQSELRSQFVALQNSFDFQYQAFMGRPAALDEIQASLPVDAALVGWVDYNPGGPPTRNRSAYHWACIVRRGQDPIWIPILGSGPDNNWTELDADRPGQLVGQLERRETNWRVAAAVLAKQRLEPLRPHLQGVRCLIVVPSPSLAGLPIEVIAGISGLPEMVVSYAPSGTMYMRLCKPRTVPQSSPLRLLALGDPAFPVWKSNTGLPALPDHGVAILSVTPLGRADLAGLQAGDVLLEYDGVALRSPADLPPAKSSTMRVRTRFWRQGHVREIEVAAGDLGIRFDSIRTAMEVLLSQRAAAEAIEPLTRGESWARLPGTRIEVEAIARLFSTDNVTVFLGEDATEAALQRTASKGGLKDYRILHFATHGRSNPNILMSSALALAPSQTANSLELESDGQITAQQIVNTWDLDADLVVLSACDSGLGRLAGGEGYLGFSQSLFIKGARTVVHSLWQVDDRATALLMHRFYQNLLGKNPDMQTPLAKADALSEAKKWLRSLDAAQAEEAMMSAGITRGERTIESTQAAARPFEHPYYWAAFVLVGDSR